MSQGAMEGGATNAQGWAGRKLLHAFSALPTFMWVVLRKEPWRVVRRMRTQGKKISNNVESSSVGNNLFILLFYIYLFAVKFSYVFNTFTKYPR
jgi:hypothetical protein